jgi:DNA-binding MarR family transcriptional regulator
MKQIIYNNLEKQKLAGWLVFSAMRLENLADQFMFKPIGMTTASIRILMLLVSTGSQSPSDLMNSLGSTKSNLTQRLNWLSKNKLVVLKKGISKDKRKVLVVITNLGKNKVKEVQLLIKKNNLQIENYFTKKESQEFLRLLKKLNFSLDQCESNSQYYEKK